MISNGRYMGLCGSSQLYVDKTYKTVVVVVVGVLFSPVFSSQLRVSLFVSPPFAYRVGLKGFPTQQTQHEREDIWLLGNMFNNAIWPQFR